ncbi:MAG: hypothetical protein JRI23_15220 [Deltaproteobacteria bacterium]|jgi:hypothetical protein|nr:hypothetical protein [Deltaproteobacteria bacterium]MBW2533099.1 hypothetical protein [Deltaproteobacteria bacterium]
MRLACALALIALAGCYMGKTPSDEGSGGASACDDKGSCQECLACADANPCAQLISNCVTNAACAGLDQCITLCGADTTCQQQCYMNNPTGVSPYNAAQDCRYCDQCPSDCSGIRDCE